MAGECRALNCPRKTGIDPIAREEQPVDRCAYAGTRRLPWRQGEGGVLLANDRSANQVSVARAGDCRRDFPGRERDERVAIERDETVGAAGDERKMRGRLAEGDALVEH